MKKNNWLQVVTYIIILVIGLCIGYFMWNNSTPPDIFTPKGIAEIPPLSPIEKSTPPKKVEVKKVIKPKVPKKPVENINPIKPKPITREKLERTKMGISDKKIGKILTAISENLEDKKLAYNRSLMQDCSGIFHQIKDSLQERLPALAGAEYQYPSPKKMRSSRQIADWFYRNNNLLIVEDAVASRNAIRPGSVLFYGKSNKTFTNINIDMLTDRKNNHSSKGAIMHVAVVTAIKTDKKGNVIGYTIMHGRNSKNPASRTSSKAIQSKRTKGLPPFGNWSQQLVAIANIATEKK